MAKVLSQPYMVAPPRGDGTPNALAEAYFYLAGTTTPVIVYNDPGLSGAMSQPVVADDVGMFIPLYFDEAVPIRMVMIPADGSLADPIIDVTSIA